MTRSSSIPHSAVPKVGASGAIAGVLGGRTPCSTRGPACHAGAAHLPFAHRAVLRPILELPLVPDRRVLHAEPARRARHARLHAGGVAFLAHVGGFVAGLLFVRPFRPRRRPPVRHRFSRDRRAARIPPGPAPSWRGVSTSSARRASRSTSCPSTSRSTSPRVSPAETRNSPWRSASRWRPWRSLPRFSGRWPTPAASAGFSSRSSWPAPWNGAGRRPGAGGVALPVFALANVAFQCADVFYNAMLPDVARPGRARARLRLRRGGVVCGSLLAMLVALPVRLWGDPAKLPEAFQVVCDAISVSPVSSKVTLPGSGATHICRRRSCGSRPRSLCFSLQDCRSRTEAPAVPLDLPGNSRGLLRFFAACSPRCARCGRRRRSSGFSSPRSSLRCHPHRPDRDVDLLELAVGMTDAGVQLFLLVCTAVVVLGGLLYGVLCQRVTIGPRRSSPLATRPRSSFSRFSYATTGSSTASASSRGWLRRVKVTLRLGLIALVPKERLTEFFGFFTLAGEAASVLGPLLWAGTLALFPDRSPAGYRAGLVVLFVVLAVAIASFRKVRFPERA